MKRVLKILCIVLVFISLIYFYNPFLKESDIKLLDENKTIEVVKKGIKGAIDLAEDEKGNLYIAYKDKIQVIYVNGYSNYIVKNKEYNITSMEYYNSKLYYASGSKLIEYSLDNLEEKILINNIPNEGDYRESLIKIKDSYIYVSIGSATNSGVVGEDNFWISANPNVHDISPYNIVLNGKNFNNNTQGAFKAYNKSSQEGETIEKNLPANAMVLKYNLENGDIENYACGIRNIKGMDFNSEGNIVATVGGMENRGLRPISNDVDYIYELKEKNWYGFPDYSGGEPVNSPRFKDENGKSEEFIVKNHPNNNPPEALYNHESLNAISCLAVDREGVLGDKDTIYFYNYEKNMILSYSKGKILNNLLIIKGKSSNKVKIIKNKIYILSIEKGVLYTLGIKSDENLNSEN